jgi:hypothetical protein
MFMEGRRVEENHDEKIVTNQADATSEKKSFNVPKKLVYSLLALLLLGGALLVGTIIGGRTANAPGPSPKTISKQKKPAPTSDGSVRLRLLHVQMEKRCFRIKVLERSFAIQLTGVLPR